MFMVVRNYIYSGRYNLFLTQDTKMAKANKLLIDAFKDATPKNPALTSADKIYLRGLTRRGFTSDEILAIAAKTGIKVTLDDLTPKPKK
jgi:SOS response regulatory protein OraA/RecX